MRSSVICEAIRSLARLEFSYNGQTRVVEPYCHGVSTAGKESLRAIQVGGARSNAEPELASGKLWSVAKMSRLRVLTEHFVPNDRNYNPNDSAMAEIHCRIERAE